MDSLSAGQPGKGMAKSKSPPPSLGDLLAPPSPLASKCISGEYEAEFDDDMGVNVHAVKLLTFSDLAKKPRTKTRVRKVVAKKAIKKKAKRKSKRKGGSR